MLQVAGTIKDEDSGRKLPGCVVVVFQDGTEFDRLEVDNNAGYSFELPLRHLYTFQFVRDGFTSKKVSLDVSDVPDTDAVDGFGFDLDMTLFKTIEGFDESILDTPIGMGTYDVESGKFNFDMEHTDRVKQRIENEKNRILSNEENRSKNKRAFDVAMKQGENAMKKKDWQEALGFFEEALVLIPGEQEAIEERDKARRELDAIAADLSEQQAEEDAARAAKEAKAAALEAERLAQEADARQRKADADARNAQSNQVTADAAAADSAAQAEIEAAKERDAKEAEEAERKRATLLANTANNVPDDAEKYYRDALKSESQARADELASRVQAHRDMLNRRKEEAKQRSQVVLDELRSGDRSYDLTGEYVAPVYRNYDHTVVYDAPVYRNYDHTVVYDAPVYRDYDLTGEYVAPVYRETHGTPTISESNIDLPQGITESSYTIQNAIVIERTIRNGDHFLHYRKVVMKTGTYYFKENHSITSSVWHRETTGGFD